MLLKLKPSASTSKLKLSDGFISGTPGLGTEAVVVSGFVAVSFPTGSGKRPPFIDSLEVTLEAYVKYPKDTSGSTTPPTPFTLLSKSETLMTANKQTSPYLQKQAPSSTKQQRVTEIPFSFSISTEELDTLPPSIQLSPSGPSNGSPYGLKYVLRAVCKFTSNTPISDDITGMSDVVAKSVHTGVVTDSRLLSWPNFKESNLLAVMRSDISDAWNEEDSRTEGREGVGDVMNEGGLALKLAVEAATERLGAIRGNSIKRIGCCTSDVGLCDKKVAVIVGNGGWRGEVEFESDTICYGDRRRIYYQVHDPEYFKLMKEQRNLTDFDTMNGQIVKVRRGTAQFEVILVESWNWIGLPDKFGSREISLLKSSESEIEEFSERQLAYIKFPDFLLPSIRVLNIEVSHKLVFRFEIPPSPIRFSTRVPEFDVAGNVMSRKLFVDQKWTPISAVKFLPEGKDSYTDVEQIIMSAAVRVAAFNRNDADMLFTDTIHIPESVISLLPSGFISRNKKDVYGNPSSSDLLQQQQHQQSYASSSSKGSLVKRLSKVFPKRSNSIHSKTSSMESVASLPQAQQLQPTHLGASKSSPLAKAQSLAALPSGLIQQPTILSLSTAPSIYHNPTTGQPLIARSVSSSGKFGIIQPLSSSVTAKQQELLGMQRVPPYPNATVRTKFSAANMSRANTSATTESVVAASSSGGSPALSAGKLVSTMDLKLCKDLSKSGLL